MSSLKDLASLIMVPSLYKDGELHTVKPLADENIIVHPDATDNNDGVDGTTPSTSSNFTFSRGSNLAATRVDVNGLIEKGRENLLLQSQSFDNASWTKGNSSVTANSTTAPDNTTTADKLIENTANNTHYTAQNSTASNEVYTYSVYVKPDTLTRVRIQMSDLTTGDVRLEYDFTTETKAHNTSGSRGSWSSIGYTITNISNGWVRFSLSAKKGAGSVASCSVFLLDASGNSIYTGDGTSGLFVWGAQLEQGLVATDYIETGASTAQAGILEDMPRLDYSASCPSLLLEPQRTNLLNHGEYFGAWTLNAGGTGSTPVLEANTTDTLSPEGRYNAYKVTLDAGSGTTTSDESIMYRSKSGLTAGSNHTASVYLKGATGGEEVIVRDTEGSYKKWTLTTEWARYEYTQIASASSYATSFGIRQGVVGIINSNAVVYVYGFQSELGSYPTSYIPTYGTSQTRSGESGTTNIANLINASAGVLFLDYIANDITSTYPVDFQLQYNGTNSVNGVTIFQQGSTPSVAVRSGSTQVFYAALTSTSLGARNKIALAYNDNDFVVYQNGVKKAEDFSGNAPIDLNEIRISDGTRNFSINQALLFKTRLTNAELAALTTI